MIHGGKGQIWFFSQAYWPIFGPMGAKKHTRIGQNLGFRTISSKFFHWFTSNVAWAFRRPVFRTDFFRGQSGHFWPSGGPKMTRNPWKTGFPDVIVQVFFTGPLLTWHRHSRDQSSELIWFRGLSGHFWPSGGPKTTWNEGFRTISSKSFHWFTSNLAGAFIRPVFRTDSILGSVGPFLTLWWPENDPKWGFPDNIDKVFALVHF